MKSLSGCSSPDRVVAARFAHAQQRAFCAYRRHLRDEVLPNPLGGDAKDRKSAQRSLLATDSIELLIYPWRFSPFVTGADIAAAGLESAPANANPVTRRALGRMLWKQYGEEDPEPYERRASRAADGWLIYGLVVEIEHRANLKELRGTALLDGLMRAYFLTLAREVSPQLVSNRLEDVAAHG